LTGRIDLINEDLTRNEIVPASDLPDFSLVLGGPLFQLYQRTHLSLDALELLHRRILIVPLFAWLPLLILSALNGGALDRTIRIPFLYDVESHVRFLIALPVLIIAEVIVHQRISPLVRRFVERRIVLQEDLAGFSKAVSSALRARNAVASELAVLVLVYTLGLWFWRGQVVHAGATWFAAPEGTHLNLTLAGYWYAFVSIPIFQFLLLRWYMRLVLWFRFLWQVSRLNLHLSAAHPDRAGGVGFLINSSYAFVPVLVAEGALLAGVIANRILYEGRSLMSFKVEAAGFVCFFLLLVLSPLASFTPRLMAAKRKGLAEYGLLANRYIFGFEQKWIGGGAEEASELLGAADIQSLADLANSYSVVRDMRIFPFGLRDIARLAAATAAPLLPLALTTFSLEELLTRLVKTVL